MATLAEPRSSVRTQLLGIPHADQSRSTSGGSRTSRPTGAATSRSTSSPLLFILSLFAEVIANDKPLLVYYDGGFYYPFLQAYPETTFGGDFPTETDYRDPFVTELIEERGWLLWPPIPYSYDTVIYDLSAPAPSPPDRRNWLGTDDQARDVVARVIYGFRISVLFGLAADHPELDHRRDRRARCKAITAAGSTCCSSASSRSGPRCRRCTC